MDETFPDRTKCHTAIHTEVLSAKMNTLTEPSFPTFLSVQEACQLAGLDQTEPTGAILARTIAKKKKIGRRRGRS